MTFKASMLGALASVLAIGAASAADLPSRKAPPVAPAPLAYSWTGYHFGVVGGYAGGEASYNLTNYALSGPLSGGAWATNPSIGTSGYMVGVDYGYNWQFANNLVIGYESEFSYANVSNNGGSFVAGGSTAQLQWFGAERLRFGYAMGRLMPYLTGGLAYGGYQNNGSSFGLMIPINNGGNNWRAGWTVGAGLEYALTDNFSVKGEYLYASLSTRNGSAIGLGGQTFTTLNSGLYGLNIARVGVNYQFKSLGALIGMNDLGL